MIAMLAASQGLSPEDPSFWMPLAFMGLLFVVIAAGMVLDGFDPVSYTHLRAHET